MLEPSIAHRGPGKICARILIYVMESVENRMLPDSALQIGKSNEPMNVVCDISVFTRHAQFLRSVDLAWFLRLRISFFDGIIMPKHTNDYLTVCGGFENNAQDRVLGI